MPSTKHRANHGSRDKLPKRFQPYLGQARTEGAIRYGAQESALQGLFDDATQQYTRQATAQDAAARSLLGSLQGAGVRLDRAYSDAGLTPEVRAQYAQTPDGQRILASLARGQADIQQQELGAQAGRQFIQQRLADDYRSDVGKINQQRVAMATERGLFESSLLDQLIGEDRSRRHDARAAAREQQYDAEQAILNRQAQRSNTALGQGYTVGPRGRLRPIPGGKADPNAPQNQKQKKPTKPTGADRDVQKDVRKAASWVKSLDASVKETDPAKRRAVVQELLTKGDQTSGIPSITSAGLDVALDMFYDGALSPATVRALHDAGVKVKFLGGHVRTETQRRREQSRRRPPNRPRPPRNAPGPYRQDRPT